MNGIYKDEIMIDYTKSDYHEKRHKDLLDDFELQRAWGDFADIAYFSDAKKNHDILEFGSGLGNNLLTVKRYANVRWYLSIDKTKLPKTALHKNKTTYRSITMDGNEIEFSGGFTDLHTLVYQDILSGKGYGIKDARQAVEIAEQIRTATISAKSDMFHPILFK